MKKYKAIFFDLDHTLWDFDSNSEETLHELHLEHNLTGKGISDAGNFISVYKSINAEMWSHYQANRITKEALRLGRFKMALEHFGVNDHLLVELLAHNYLDRCPEKTNLFPGTHDVLSKLKEKYSLHIITNGFREVQFRKMSNTGLTGYFDQIHISEEIGYKKPEPEIFLYAVKQSRVPAEACIMIGDNLETDIEGAKKAGIDHIYFNPEKKPVMESVMHEIHDLHQLIDFFDC